MRCASLALLSSLTFYGCTMPLTSAQQLSESAYDLNTAARFGRMDIASEHVREVAREEFSRNHANWGRSVRVVDIELNGMSMRKDGDADVSVTVSWQMTAETTTRTTDITQRWTPTRGAWALLSEEERGGDKGLISQADEPTTATAAPPPASRPRYQTHVMYEQ